MFKYYISTLKGIGGLSKNDNTAQGGGVGSLERTGVELGPKG